MCCFSKEHKLIIFLYLLYVPLGVNLSKINIKVKHTQIKIRSIRTFEGIHAGRDTSSNRRQLWGLQKETNK